MKTNIKFLVPIVGKLTISDNSSFDGALIIHWEGNPIGYANNVSDAILMVNNYAVNKIGRRKLVIERELEDITNLMAQTDTYGGWLDKFKCSDYQATEV